MLLRQRRVRVAHWAVAPESRRCVTGEFVVGRGSSPKSPVVSPSSRLSNGLEIFERVWLDDGRIVAVRPKEAFAPFFLGRRYKTAGRAVL